jgi:hypothetical protein
MVVRLECNKCQLWWYDLKKTLTLSHSKWPLLQHLEQQQRQPMQRKPVMETRSLQRRRRKKRKMKVLTRVRAHKKENCLRR